MKLAKVFETGQGGTYIHMEYVEIFNFVYPKQH